MLCNLALERLKDIDSNQFEIRKASPFDFCFQRSDPKPLQSGYDGTEVTVQRYPDVAGTSRVVAVHVADEGNFELVPKVALRWCQTFTTIEFKVLKKSLMSKFNDTANDNFTSISRSNTIEQFMLDKSDPIPAISDQEEQQESQKRKSRDDHTEGPPVKIRRSTTGKSPSVYSASQFIGTSESQKAVSHRVQLATYALEMLSYSLGVHHAINLLIIGKSFPTYPYRLEMKRLNRRYAMDMVL